MTARRVTPEQLSALRHRLYDGEQVISAATARQLMDEIDELRRELGVARVTFATKAARALETRLRSVATFNHGGCPTCRDAEAQAFLAKLRRIAAEHERSSR